MPFTLNKRIAGEIGQFMWKVPVANAMASRRWGGPGVMMGSMLAQLNSGGDSVKPSAFKDVAGASAADDPRQWEDLGKETYLRIVNLPKAQETLRKATGGSAPPVGFRCNQFASAMVHMLRLNANVEATVEIVRMGASTSNCHYIVVLGRNRTTSDASGLVSNDKDSWGAEHVLMDPWGAKQRKPAWHVATPASAGRERSSSSTRTNSATRCTRSANGPCRPIGRSDRRSSRTGSQSSMRRHNGSGRRRRPTMGVGRQPLPNSQRMRSAWARASSGRPVTPRISAM